MRPRRGRRHRDRLLDPPRPTPASRLSANSCDQRRRGRRSRTSSAVGGRSVGRGVAGVSRCRRRGGRGSAPRRGRPPRARSAPGRSNRSARCGGSGGRMPVAASTASGNLAGCAVPRHTIGTPGVVPPQPPGDADADGGVRVMRIIPVRLGAPSGSTRQLARRRADRRRSARCSQRQHDRSATDTVPSARNARISSATAAPSRPSISNSSRSRLDDTWMSIDGLVARARRRVISIVPVVKKRVRMSLRLDATISCSIGKPHPHGGVPGEDVAEVAGGHAEADTGSPVARPRARAQVT